MMTHFRQEVDKIIAQEQLTFKLSTKVVSKLIETGDSTLKNLEKVKGSIQTNLTRNKKVAEWCKSQLEAGSTVIEVVREQICIVEQHVSEEYIRLLNHPQQIPDHVTELLRIAESLIRNIERGTKQNKRCDLETARSLKNQLVHGEKTNLDVFISEITLVKSELQELYDALHVEALDWIIEKQDLGNQYLKMSALYFKKVIEKMLRNVEGTVIVSDPVTTQAGRKYESPSVTSMRPNKKMNETSRAYSYTKLRRDGIRLTFGYNVSGVNRLEGKLKIYYHVTTDRFNVKYFGTSVDASSMNHGAEKAIKETLQQVVEEAQKRSQ